MGIKIHVSYTNTKYRYSNVPPKDVVIACPPLNHQEGSNAIASSIDIEDHGRCESIHQC